MKSIIQSIFDEELTYYDGSGNGYIKDKAGHVYDVIASTRSGDAGRIAGGSTNYYVCIKKANGTDDFVVTGYVAIFSSGSNAECVSDIRAGYYLEDYISALPLLDKALDLIDVKDTDNWTLAREALYDIIDVE